VWTRPAPRRLTFSPSASVLFAQLPFPDPFHVQAGLFSNPWIWLGIATMMLSQAALIYLPAMNWLFHTAPIGHDEWLFTLGGGLVIYLAIGTEKLIRQCLLSKPRS